MIITIDKTFKNIHRGHILFYALSEMRSPRSLALCIISR